MLIVQVLCDVKVVITETLIYASPLLIVAFTIERSRRIRIIFKMLVRSRLTWTDMQRKHLLMKLKSFALILQRTKSAYVLSIASYIDRPDLFL